jgi:hypothetical protein
MSNIEMNLRKTGRGVMDWIDLAQDRDRWRSLVKSVIKLRTAYNVGEYLSGCKTGGLSRRSYFKYCMLLVQFRQPDLAG